MKIGIDVREAARPNSGKAVYTLQLVSRLIKMQTRHEFVLYTHERPALLPQSERTRYICLPEKGFSWHRRVARHWREEEGELFFAPTSFIIPWLLPKRYATSITVHDMIAFQNNGLHSWKPTMLERFLLGRVLTKTRAILTPSEQTKRDLQQRFSVEDERISVTPLGVDERFFEQAGEEELATFKDEHQLPKHFILAVSGLQPRKNIGRLVEAFEKIAPDFPEVELVIIGGNGWNSAETVSKIKESSAPIRQITDCLPELLPSYYQAATVFAYPSLYEGFGLPILEAFASGCPVLCSERSSLPEVGGEACSYVDPTDTEAIAEGLAQLLKDPVLRNKLGNHGQKRAREFSWERTAEKTLEAWTSLHLES